MILKKKFDDIFDSTRYSKALEAVLKAKKEKSDRAKNLRIELAGFCHIIYLHVLTLTILFKIVTMKSVTEQTQNICITRNCNFLRLFLLLKS